MKRIGQLAVCLLLAGKLLTGCGSTRLPEVIESSVIAVSGKGQVTAYLIEDFDKAYYDLSELSSMAAEEVAEFNAAKKAEDKTPVSVEPAEKLGEAKVRLAYQFDTWETYTEFNEGNLFYGTVSEAAGKGYLTGVTVKSIKDGSVLDEKQLAEQGDRKIIITDAAADIYCPAKVSHVSEGVSVNEDGSVAASQKDGLVYIVMK